LALKKVVPALLYMTVTVQHGEFMIRAAMGFFILALFAFVLGANNIAGTSIEFGKILIAVALFVFVLSFVANLFTGRKPMTIKE
jgi:uncharacterized membrane protein YtjA (UPF0391 family)